MEFYRFALTLALAAPHGALGAALSTQWSLTSGDCPSDCHNRGACRGGRCYCVAGWGGKACDVKQCSVCAHGKCIDGECVCDAGFKFNSDGTCQRCAPGSHKSERGNGPCEPCFNGASCGGDGSAYALEALPLDDGWCRLSPSSKVAYRCPLYGTCPNSTVRAGVEGEGCRTGHRGPLCAACEASISSVPSYASAAASRSLQCIRTTPSW